MKTKGRRTSKNVVDLRADNTDPNPRKAGPYRSMFSKSETAKSRREPKRKSKRKTK